MGKHEISGKDERRVGIGGGSHDGRQTTRTKKEKGMTKRVLWSRGGRPNRMRKEERREGGTGDGDLEACPAEERDEWWWRPSLGLGVRGSPGPGYRRRGGVCGDS